LETGFRLALHVAINDWVLGGVDTRSENMYLQSIYVRGIFQSVSLRKSQVRACSSLTKYLEIAMTAVVAKWGNSLAIRIPRAVAEQAHITEGTGMDITVEGNSIIFTPRKRKKYTLDELLEGMTPEKFHPEFETGNAVGNEHW
jgi:antitoxin MazE